MRPHVLAGLFTASAATLFLYGIDFAGPLSSPAEMAVFALVSSVLAGQLWLRGELFSMHHDGAQAVQAQEVLRPCPATSLHAGCAA